jgi:hypothetical protein
MTRGLASKPGVIRPDQGSLTRVERRREFQNEKSLLICIPTEDLPFRKISLGARIEPPAKLVRSLTLCEIIASWRNR